jgi:hypothetical protein
MRPLPHRADDHAERPATREPSHDPYSGGMSETEKPEKGFFRSLAWNDWIELALYVVIGVSAVSGAIAWLMS